MHCTDTRNTRSKLEIDTSPEYFTIDAALRGASLPPGLTTFTGTWLAGRTNSESS